MQYYLTAIILALGLGFLVWGVFISIKISGLPDITTDGSYTLGAAATGMFLSENENIFYAMIVSVLLGSFAGFITGIIHTRMKIQALLSGILVMTALYSVNLIIMGKSNIPLLENNMFYDSLTLTPEFYLNQLIILSVFAGTTGLFLKRFLKTDMGIALRATANADNMARSMGINSDNYKILGLAIANGLTALSGSLITQIQKFADINMGVGIVIFGLGSVMIGEALIKLINVKGMGWDIFGAMLGCILFRLIIASTIQFGADPVLLRLITSIIVILILGLVHFRIKKTQ